MSVSDPQLRIAQLESELKWAHLKIRVLEEKLRQQRIRLLGPHSETLDNLQLELLADEEPSATSDEVAAEAQREPIARKPARERKPHPGREPLPESLPRVDKIIPCAEQTCPNCGKETAVIGYDSSEQLDVEPARYFVRVIKREKRACRGCEQATVQTAPDGAGGSPGEPKPVHNNFPQQTNPLNPQSAAPTRPPYYHESKICRPSGES